MNAKSPMMNWDHSVNTEEIMPHILIPMCFWRNVTENKENQTSRKVQTGIMKKQNL